MRGASRSNSQPASIVLQSLCVMVATLTTVLVCSGWLLGIGIALHQVEHARWHIFVPSGFHATIDRRLAPDRQPDVVYDSIQLRRPWNVSDESVYSVVFHSDGRAELEVERGPPEVGDCVGFVSHDDYGRLSQLVDLLGFRNFAHEYTSDSSHASACEVSVVGAFGTKSVTEDGSSGPTELWALQECTDSIRQRVKWTAK